MVRCGHMFFAAAKTFVRKPLGIAIILAILLVAWGGYRFVSPNKELNRDTVIVKKGDVTQEVSVTGRVRAAQNVDLAFEKSGRVRKIFVKVGDRTLLGQRLVELEHADLTASLAEAEATVKMRHASLDELKRGARPEEIQIQEAKVTSARISLEDAKNSAINYVQDAFTKADDALAAKVDQFFSNPKSTSPQLIFTDDFQRKIDLEFRRLRIEQTFIGWKKILTTEVIAKDVQASVMTARQNLLEVRSLVDTVSIVINGLTPSSNLTQTTLNTYKSDVSTARTNINTAVTNLATAEEKLRSAQSSLALAEEELALKKAGSSSEEIISAQAQLESAEAGAGNIKAQIAKTILLSPFSGTVTRQETKVGEIVPPNMSVVSLSSTAQYEVEAFVPEVDIAKIHISDGARVTLDAYGNDVNFEAVVVAIDPAETIIEGVATYKVTLQFAKDDNRIKSGMTANVDISTARRTGVLFVPQRAIVAKNGDRIVRILRKNGTASEAVEVRVKVGLRGSDGSVEILEGLAEGDTLVIGVE